MRRLTPQHAGNYRICSGSPAYPNLTVPQRKPWITAVRRHLRRRIKANDPLVLAMLRESASEWATFEATPFHHFGTQRPIGKAQALIAHLLKQGRTPLDILSVAIATILISEHGNIPRPPKLPYFRAIQVGLAVRWLIKPVFKYYDREDQRTGLIVTTKVNVSAPVRMRSRNACQRLEIIIRKHSSEFLSKYGGQIAHQVVSSISC